MKQVKSLDELELEKYKPYSRLIDSPCETVDVVSGFACKSGINKKISLNGEWELAADGYTDDRTDVSCVWEDAIKGNVPSSVHTMLLEAGKIPDPFFAINDKKARDSSYHTWWMKKTFTYDGSLGNPMIHFEGVCYRAKFWLNGHYLGWHSGMFGGPDYYVGEFLQKENVLIVEIFNAPTNPFPYSSGDIDLDEGWKFGTVINCVYGWHYASIPSRGIWKPVYLGETPAATAEKPFFYTLSTDGTVDLVIKTFGKACRGKIDVSISPKNFEGETVGFEKEFEKEEGSKTLHYRFKVPDPELWWPNDLGEQNLYNAAVNFIPENDIPTYFTTHFGIRTVEMCPQPGGPSPDTVNLTYRVNGRKIFVKGTNWCTTDALLRFTKERYRRFLSLAKDQHIQLLRAWGGGMPESDDFYDICDELGIMVRQEWPTCWDSDRLQPRWELAETVAVNLIRIRNHPSLVTIAGGNESFYAESETMTKMAQCTMENDGSRAFQKTSPFLGPEGKYSGTIHNYDTYWEMKPIDATLVLSAAFVGEFGAASSPNLHSVMRYLPDSEKNRWPLEKGTAFWHHTPRFNGPVEYPDDMYLNKHVHEFVKSDSMQEWIDATQLLQATITRHLLEKMRSQWPDSVGICYYKLTDVFPSASWSTVDYYGVQKLSYYVVQDAYSPVHSSLIFNSVDVHGGDVLPVFFFDDNNDTEGKKISVKVRAFGSSLGCLKEEEYDATGKTGFSSKVGEFTVTDEMAESKPLFIVSEVFVDGKSFDRTFYWLNFKDNEGCMYELKKALLDADIVNGVLTIKNISDVAAAGVLIECDDNDETFTASDSMLWIDAGETVSVAVNRADGISLRGFNVDKNKI